MSNSVDNLASALHVKSAAGKRFCIVSSRWHRSIAERLIEGAIVALTEHGANRTDISLVTAPGTFEIPLICKQLALSGSYDGIVAIGALIKGATDHYRLIADSVSFGITQAMLDTGVPIGFGVIAADTVELAMERAGGAEGNKGAEAALATIETAQILSDPDLNPIPECCSTECCGGSR